MNLFVPKNDRLRHKILGILLKLSKEAEKENNNYINVQESNITTKKLAKILKITEQQVRDITSPMQREQEIRYDDFGEGECLYAWKDCNAVYHEKKYLNLGRDRVTI